jgi:tripartite-type tricarboxylate transporter receptor subunit TctC
MVRGTAGANRCRLWRTATAFVLSGVLAACGSDSDSGAPDSTKSAAEPLFQGEVVDLVVPYKPGGGYDTYARAISPYLEECLDSRVVVKNEPGAGGLVATNQTASAPASANRMQIVNTTGLITSQLAEAEGARFDVRDLQWIGRVAAPPLVLVVAAESSFQSFQDVVDAEQPVRFVAQGPGTNDFIAPNIVGQAYGFPFEVVSGFQGSGEARTALISGDADAHVLPIDSQLSAIESGDVRAVVTVDEEPDVLLPDVPTIYETDPPSEEAQDIIESLVTVGQTGRGMIVSPEMAEDRVSALREGLQCALENPDLISAMETQKRPLSPLGGEETARLVEDAFDAPEEFRQLVADSY